MRKRAPTDTTLARALRIPDAARLHSVGEQVLFDAIRRGELKAAKLGDAPRSPVVTTPQWIDEYLHLRLIRPTAEAA